MRILCLLLILGSQSFIFSQPFNKLDILGQWRTYDEKTNEPNGIIEFFYSKGEIKAKVVDAPDVYNADGSLKKDLKNPDPKKRSRLLKGLVFLYDFTWDEEKHIYRKGSIYDSRSGGTYSAQMELVNRNRLKVTGYMGITLFGKTVYWDRIKK